jgi:multidrug efflux system membrane fusion protein
MDSDLTVSRPTLDEPAGTAPVGKPRAGWLRWPVLVPLALALVVAGTIVVRSNAAAKAKPAPAARVVPVVTAGVRVGDMPVNLSGLGTVVPTEAVTVRTRVDGQLMSVNFREGQMVRKGDLLMQVDPRPYQVQLLQAEGQLAKDQAALRNAQRDLERFRTLVQQGILPQQQLDTQVSTVDQGEAAIKTDQAAVESAKLNLTYSRITAPLAGKTGLRLVDPGNMVKASDANGLVVITPVAPINVLFTIPADHVQHVLANSQGGKPLAVEAWDRDFTRRLAVGTLLAVDNQVDTATGTVRLKAQFPNQDGALFPNQFVNAKLRTDVLHGALVAPAAAVQRSPRGNFVYVVKADQTVDLRPVELQLTEGDSVVLKGGVQSGEQVVVDGLDKLSPGMKVAATDAAAAAKAPAGNPPGKAPAGAPAAAPKP